MKFADKLAVLVEKGSSSRPDVAYDGVLEVRQPRRFLGVLHYSPVVARIHLNRANDEWRVMVSYPDKPNGPFWGADYSTTTGDDADSALLAVWVRESDEWRRCVSTELASISQRIADVIDAALVQYTDSAT